MTSTTLPIILYRKILINTSQYNFYIKMTITVEDYIGKLTSWSMDIHARTKILDRGSRFYLGFGWLVMMTMGMLNVTLIALNVVFLSDQTLSSTTKLALNIVVLSLQVILAMCTFIDKVVQPLKRSSDLAMCGKFYDQLSRELEVNVANAKENMDFVNHENYMAILNNMAMHEQLIHQLEPGMVFIGRYNPIVGTYISANLPITYDEADWLASLINRHKGRKRERLVELFNRVLTAITEQKGLD